MSALRFSGARRMRSSWEIRELRPRPLGLLFLIAACLLAASGQILRQLGDVPETVPAAAGEVTCVRTVRLQPVVLRSRSTGTGLLAARRSVDLFAEIPGRVLEVGAETLDHVYADQLLMQVDPLLAQLSVREGAASVARAETDLVLARATFSRRRALADRQATSASTLEEAENRVRVAEAALESGRAALERARDRLSRTTIRAPFAGLLRRFDAEEGEFAREGETIAELLDVSRVRISIGLSDREIVALSAGAPARVRVEAYSTEEFQGEVLRVGRAADPDTKRFPVQIEIPNPEGRLLPGMVARVEIELAESTPRLLIPREAVLSELGQYLVYVVEQPSPDEKTVVRRRQVTVREISFRPTELEVVSGLEAGDEIAVSDLNRLVEGRPIARRVSSS